MPNQWVDDDVGAAEYILCTTSAVLRVRWPEADSLMIPLNSDGPNTPRRTFSPRVTQELSSALTQYNAESGEGEEPLRNALRRAAEESREHGLEPGELVLAFKAIASELKPAIPQSPQAREKAYSMALRAMLIAYFSESKGLPE